MLGLLLLMALPNLMPVVQSSAHRHAVDDLAFFIDDVRLVSRSHPNPLRFRPGHAIDQEQPVIKRLLLRHGAVRRAQVEVLKPFAFSDGKLIAKHGFGRVALSETHPIRFVDVTATGLVCARKATADQIAHLITVALNRWEPRIVVNRVESHSDTTGTVRVAIHYTIRSTQSLQELSLLLNPSG